MDFNQIIETILPYLGTTTILGGVVTIVIAIVKFVGLFKKIKADANIDTLMSEYKHALLKALPGNLTINVETLVKQELYSLQEQIRTAFLKDIRDNTMLLESLAKAICSLHTVPDAVKAEIGALLKNSITPAATYTVELSKEFENISKDQNLDVKKIKKPVRAAAPLEQI